jgi:hypothetical protein
MSDTEVSSLALPRTFREGAFLIESGELTEFTVMDSNPDAAESRQALINKHDLEGQKTRSKITFRALTPLEITVYRTCFPVETKIGTYSDEPIPLRVLELYDKAVDQGVQSLTVWHPRVANTDPVLVGRPSSEWNAPTLLIARWGTALLPFVQLQKEASELVLGELLALKSKILQDISNLKESPVSMLSKITPGRLYYSGLT